MYSFKIIEPKLAVKTLAVMFPISIKTRKIDDFLIKNMTLNFFLVFKSSISDCESEKMEDSETEKIEEIMINKMKNKIYRNKGIIIVKEKEKRSYRCLKVISLTWYSELFLVNLIPLKRFVIAPILLILTPQVFDRAKTSAEAPSSAVHKSS